MGTEYSQQSNMFFVIPVPHVLILMGLLRQHMKCWDFDGLLLYVLILALIDYAILYSIGGATELETNVF